MKSSAVAWMIEMAAVPILIPRVHVGRHVWMAVLSCPTAGQVVLEVRVMDEKLSELLLRVESDSPPSRDEIGACYTREVIDTLVKIARAREAEDSSAYGELENCLDDVRSDLTDSIHAITRKPMWQIIIKLRQSGELTDYEMKLIRLWLVGDADAYLQEEDNFGDWIAELDRLTSEIELRREGSVELDNLLALYALLKDARGVSRDIANFLNVRERVAHFEKSTGEGPLDADTRNALADILARTYNEQIP
jgi:hypothetical protein